VLVLADVPGWAWDRKARAYAEHLSNRFRITVAYHATVPPLTDFDLVHCFEVSQTGILSGHDPATRPFKAVAGLTANVWRTWGPTRMHEWASRVDALHGNSVLIAKELAPFHPRVYYTPNGVDPVTYQRRGPRPPGPLVFGHVGKLNPRKGGEIIVRAARAAKVELRLIQRTAKLALSEAQMVDWYQGIDVMVTASNMDGTPNPMLEGAACECALLSTAIGNMPEFIVDGRNGILLQQTLPYLQPGPDLPGEPAQQRIEALTEEIAHWMRTLSEDAARTAAMGRNARDTVLDGWTWAQQTAAVARMWFEVLG
jgi:glycosyltransferase involved in cell wall biosynthesis